MKFFKDSKVSNMTAQAEQAMKDGRTVFAPRLNMPALKLGFSGGVEDWALMIEAIEAVGWRMEHWSVTTDGSGGAEAYPLFRR